MRIECSAVELPKFPKHTNRLPFLGILGFVDKPSDKPPAGARGHRVLLTREAALTALPSVVGMGLCRSGDSKGHDQNRKFGIITKAYLLGNRIVVRGIIYGKDCPKDVDILRKGKFGMSYEISNAHVPDLRADIWELNRVEFTGAAVLLVEKAAYKKTRFWIAQ